MRIAIVGAGFAGLAVAWHLLRFSCKVEIWDDKGIGGGASGVATGLLHPYPGEKGRRTWQADHCLAGAKVLLTAAERQLKRSVSDQGGILAYKDKEFARNVSFGDLEVLGSNHFLISSGMTIDTEAYLQGLWLDCLSMGAVLQRRKVEKLTQLQGYDHIVVAAGHSSGLFFPELLGNFQKLKGQVLTASRKGTCAKLEKSTVGKGYIAVTGQEGVYHIGATYERNFLSEDPCTETARKELYPKVSLFYKDIEKLDILQVRAGVRFSRIGHYYPLACQMAKGLWVFTALGSRGLLYHAFLGEKLAMSIFKGGNDILPKEVNFPFAK